MIKKKKKQIWYRYPDSSTILFPTTLLLLTGSGLSDAGRCGVLYESTVLYGSVVPVMLLCDQVINKECLEDLRYCI